MPLKSTAKKDYIKNALCWLRFGTVFFSTEFRNEKGEYESVDMSFDLKDLILDMFKEGHQCELYCYENIKEFEETVQNLIELSNLAKNLLVHQKWVGANWNMVESALGKIPNKNDAFEEKEWTD